MNKILTIMFLGFSLTSYAQKEGSVYYAKKNWLSSLKDTATGQYISLIADAEYVVIKVIDKHYIALLQGRDGKRFWVDTDDSNPYNLAFYFWDKASAAGMKKKYGASVWKTIQNGSVIIGWSKKLCELSWGEPERINKTTNMYGTTEQWVYSHGGYLYFTNGKLTTVQY